MSIILTLLWSAAASSTAPICFSSCPTFSHRPTRFTMSPLSHMPAALHRRPAAAMQLSSPLEEQRSAAIPEDDITSDSEGDETELDPLQPTSHTEAAGPAPVGNGAWITLAMLSLIFVDNQWARSLIYYIVDFSDGARLAAASPDPAVAAAALNGYMNLELGFDQGGYGVLGSIAFTSMFAIFSVVAGKVCDDYNRKTVALVAALGWSVSMFMQGSATSFYAVLASRLLMGVSQAFTNPAAYTILSELFSDSELGTANSVYSGGVYLGGALASLSIILVNELGWRGSSNVVGAVSVAIACLGALLLVEPRNTLPKEPPSPPLLSPAAPAPSQESPGFSLSAVGVGVSQVLEGRTSLLLLFASTARFWAGLGIGLWKAPLFRELFPDSTTEFAVVNAVIMSGCGVGSAVLGGIVTDKLLPRYGPRVRAWVPAAGSLLAIPLWIGVVNARTFEEAVTWLALEYIVAECWFGPTLALLFSSVPKDVKGSAQGLFSVTTVAGNMAPLLVGFLTSQKGISLHDTMLWVVPVAYLISGLLFFSASQSIKEGPTTPAVPDI